MMFAFDGTQVAFGQGQTVAAALWAAGHRAWRTSIGRGEPRGYYCGDGFCFDCLVVVNGHGNVRACQTAAEPAMHAAPQSGFGAL